MVTPSTPNNDKANKDVIDFCVGTDCLKQMVQRVSWFAKIDYPLFDFLSNHDIQVTAKVLACNINYNRTYTGRRLRALRDAGLLVQHDSGTFELSDLGREFLAGDLSQDELEALDPEKAENGTDEH